MGLENSSYAIGNLVAFKPAHVIEAERYVREKALADARDGVTTPVVDGLSSYIEKCWQDAKRAKEPVERQMLKNLRQRAGLYEPEKLEAIRQMGGSEIYMLLTATKCRAAEAWLNDLLRPVGDRPWSITPTPIPELPPDIQQEIEEETRAVYEEVLAQAAAVGQVIPMGSLHEEIREYARTRRDKVLQQLQEEAALRAERMATRMEDQLAEGGWYDAFWSAISDLVTLKAGIIKGPVLRKRKVQKWVRGQDGRWVVDMVATIIPEFYRVSPFDLYPAPDSRHPDDGYLIERHRLTRSDLNAMIGVPGYSEENIRKVLSEYSDGLHSTLPLDSARATLEFSGNSLDQTKGEKIEALEFWGSVQGKLLLEWGMDGDIDPDLEYEINAWKVGQYVIRAILNPDKLGRKPYSVDSFERIAGSFWGKGLPELMADIQDVCNAIARAIVNNAGLASGPQVEVNIERCEDNTEIYPWKIWQSTNRQMSEAPAVRFMQPNIVVGPLLQIYEFFSTQSEDQTGIPRYAYGNMNVSGAGSTASGLSMLMTSANRNIKEVLSHVDKMVADAISRLYDYNMLYDPDDSIKGDARIIARGSASLLAREQRQVRINEVLSTTNNPVDIQIMGPDGRSRLLKEALKGLDIPVDEILPNSEELKALIEKFEQQQAMMLQQQPPPESPQTLDAAGNPAGGVGVNMFQNAEGVHP